MPLYPHQAKSVNEVLSALKNHNGVLYQGGTGSGKTVMFCHLTSMAKGQVWILVNREELLKSAYRTLRKNHNITAELLHPKMKKFNPDGKVIIAMVQTLRNRKDIDTSKASLVIVDEAHLTDFDSQIQRFRNAKKLGLSATPKRKGRVKQLCDFYTKLISGPSVKDLIQRGFLVGCKAFTFNAIDLSKIDTFKGDYDERQMFVEFDKPTIYTGVVNNWIRLAKDTKTIVFCVNIDHAKKMTAEFLAAGIMAKFVVSVGQDESRKDILKQWSSDEFPVLVNASILTTGFDEPSLETVVLARATQSEVLYDQMIGRGARTYEGKTHFNLLDFGENLQRFGEYDRARSYSLIHSVRLKKGAPVMKECPSCHAYLLGSLKVCSECNFVFPLSKQELIEIELAPYISVNWGSIDPNNPEQLDKIMRAKKKTPAWVARQIFVKGVQGWEEMVRNFGSFKGYSNGWAYRAIENLNSKVKSSV